MSWCCSAPANAVAPVSPNRLPPRLHVQHQHQVPKWVLWDAQTHYSPRRPWFPSSPMEMVSASLGPTSQRARLAVDSSQIESMCEHRDSHREAIAVGQCALKSFKLAVVPEKHLNRLARLTPNRTIVKTARHGKESARAHDSPQGPCLAEDMAATHVRDLSADDEAVRRPSTTAAIPASPRSARPRLRWRH